MKLSKLEKISNAIGERYYTIQLMLNLFEGFGGSNIIQVGCQKRDFESFHYDLFNILADYVDDKKLQYVNYSLYHDHDDNAKAIQSLIYKQYNTKQINIKDISEYKEYKQNDIDLLILHDINYPMQKLIQQVDSKLNYLEARNILNGIEEKEFEHLFGDAVHPCRKTMLNQLKTFSSRLARRAIVVLEGNDYPGGSQTLLAKRQLEREGFICLLDLKQSVWIKR
jgi:hypothetical protein